MSRVSQESKAPLGLPDKNLPGAWRSLSVFVLLSGLSVFDRQILTLMVEPIKQDLGLSDFQIGILQGLVFAIFYSVAALPLGWMADRYPRRPIIWLGVTTWSLFTSACGLANSFVSLVIARMGVGAGEASLSPAAYSMLADLFKPSRLTLALSIMMIGMNLGNGIAIGLGGAIITFAEKGGTWVLPLFGELKSWQFVFFVAGLPGLVLGLLVFTFREPVRRGRLHESKGPELSETFRFIAANRAFFAAHFIGFGLLSTVGWAFFSWLPVYMIREFGWTIGRISAPLALITGVGATIGTLAMGWLVDRLFGNGRLNAHLLVCMGIAACMAVLGVIAFRITDPHIFLLIVTPIISIMSLGGTASAALQIVAPNEMRGQISAMFLLVISGFGLGLGPVVVGALTDFVFQDEARIGDSLTVIFAVLAPASAFAMWLGLGPMRVAVEKAQQRS